jgi:hypothetical protein
MTTIVLAHPNPHCPRFPVFGVYDGEDDRFVFDVREFEEQQKAESDRGRFRNRHPEGLTRRTAVGWRDEDGWGIASASRRRHNLLVIGKAGGWTARLRDFRLHFDYESRPPFVQPGHRWGFLQRTRFSG